MVKGATVAIAFQVDLAIQENDTLSFQAILLFLVSEAVLGE